MRVFTIIVAVATLVVAEETTTFEPDSEQTTVMVEMTESPVRFEEISEVVVVKDNTTSEVLEKFASNVPSLLLNVTGVNSTDAIATTSAPVVLKSSSNATTVSSTRRPAVRALPAEVPVLYDNTTRAPVDNEVLPVMPMTEREALIAKYCAESKGFEIPLYIQKNYPYYLGGFDFDDRPIWIAELGKYDLRRIVEDGPESIATFDLFVKLTVCRMMSSHTMRNKLGHDIDFILDFEGLQISQLASLPTMSYLLRLAHNYRKVIEDYTHYIFVMNANYVTEALANLVRPIFGKILEITDIHGTNRNKWVPELLKRFPKDQIPEWYGGEKGYNPIQIYG